MTKKAPARLRRPVHPGEFLLRKFLVQGDVTQSAFARRLGWTRARLNELIKGKRGITADAALDLARVLGTSARLWMNLQAMHELFAAEARRAVLGRRLKAVRIASRHRKGVDAKRSG